MVYEVGKFVFPSAEYYNMLIEAGIFAKYDQSPEAREQHDLEAEAKRKGYVLRDRPPLEELIKKNL
jgi:hypothetical protein